MIAKVETQEKAVEDLRENTSLHESAFLEKDAGILEPRTVVENAERYSRCNNLEICGVQQAENKF